MSNEIKKGFKVVLYEDDRYYSALKRSVLPEINKMLSAEYKVGEWTEDRDGLPYFVYTRPSNKESSESYIPNRPFVEFGIKDDMHRFDYTNRKLFECIYKEASNKSKKFVIRHFHCIYSVDNCDPMHIPLYMLENLDDIKNYIKIYGRGGLLLNNSNIGFASSVKLVREIELNEYNERFESWEKTWIF